MTSLYYLAHFIFPMICLPLFPFTPPSSYSTLLPNFYPPFYHLTTHSSSQSPHHLSTHPSTHPPHHSSQPSHHLTAQSSSIPSPPIIFLSSLTSIFLLPPLIHSLFYIIFLPTPLPVYTTFHLPFLRLAKSSSVWDGLRSGR